MPNLYIRRFYSTGSSYNPLYKKLEKNHFSFRFGSIYLLDWNFHLVLGGKENQLPSIRSIVVVEREFLGLTDQFISLELVPTFFGKEQIPIWVPIINSDNLRGKLFTVCEKGYSRSPVNPQKEPVELDFSGKGNNFRNQKVLIGGKPKFVRLGQKPGLNFPAVAHSFLPDSGV